MSGGFLIICTLQALRKLRRHLKECAGRRHPSASRDAAIMESDLVVSLKVANGEGELCAALSLESRSVKSALDKR